MNNRCLVFGACGYSGSGKTTLIEAMIGRLVKRGLTIGVVKHDVHGLQVDREGKDSDRFFKAGADVIMRGPRQSFLRAHPRSDMPLADLLRMMGPHYDLVLVEGHKDSPLEQKVWLSSDKGEGPPESCVVKRVLRRDEDRLQIAMTMIDEWLPHAWCAAPVYAGVLIGGKSSRFGSPKHLVIEEGTTWLERTMAIVRPHVEGVVILGAGSIPDSLGSVPILCDAPDVHGPLADMLAATRWRPSTSWIFLPCDLPHLEEDAVRWLLDCRRPGVHAVLPQLAGSASPEPLLAYYDFRAAPLLECASRPMDLVGAPHVETPEVPDHLQMSWKNVNTPDDRAAVR